MTVPPQVLALGSALCTASATLLIQRGLERSNFYAGAWVNVVVGAIAFQVISNHGVFRHTHVLIENRAPDLCSPADIAVVEDHAILHD